MAGKLYLFYGEDEFSARQALEELKRRLGPREVVDPNTTLFDGRSLAYPQLEMTCNTIPFLADWRVVVVDGLLDRFDQRPARSPGRTVSRRNARTSREEWEGLAALAQAMPSTTVLVLLGGKLNPRNPLLVQLHGVAEVREFPAMRGGQLSRWILERVAQLGGEITPGALRLLANFVGGNLRQLNNDLEKLCLYAGPQAIQEEDVTSLVSDARQASIFALVDSMIERRWEEAMKALRQVMDQGAAGPYIVTMLARQVRMMLQAKALEEQGVGHTEMARALGATSDFVLRKTLEQAHTYRADQLQALYRRLLDTDITIKTGAMAEELALETLVAEAAGG